MPDFPDTKAMATILRRELQHQQIDLSHSACLELVAKQHGFRDYNTLAAVRAADVTPAAPRGSLPAGWETIGHLVRSYDVTILQTGGHDGGRALMISAKESDPARLELGWIALHQRFAAKRFIGKRVAFSLMMRTERVGDSANPWIRVDNKLGHRLVAVGINEGWESTAQSGTQPWTRATLVLEVPDSAETIEIAVQLSGRAGSVLVSGMTFGETSEPVTRLRPIDREAQTNLELA
jgi:hypothetical protein